ncbi:hypothetical protein, partial [Acinetobacter baumannii]
AETTFDYMLSTPRSSPMSIQDYLKNQQRK